MNVAQELGDDELYDYDILVKLLGDRFDPASRVFASRSRFHGRSRHHHEDADSFADTITTELRRLGYPQSSPELRQELVSEQFVRGKSDAQLKKYLWVVIRTQKDRKLLTLIEVCTDFASLSPTGNVHRPLEQSSEEMFAMMDRSQWTGPGVAEPNMPPSLAHMFALTRRMGYEMRPVARRANQPPGSPLEPCAGLKVWPATAPPRSEEARTRTAPSSNAGARTAPQTSIFRPAPAPHRTMENVGPHQGPQ